MPLAGGCERSERQRGRCVAGSGGLEEIERRFTLSTKV